MRPLGADRFDAKNARSVVAALLLEDEAKRVDVFVARAPSPLRARGRSPLDGSVTPCEIDAHPPPVRKGHAENAYLERCLFAGPYENAAHPSGRDAFKPRARRQGSPPM